MAWKRAGTERFVASIGLVLAGAAAAHAAAVTEVTSRAALGANDLLDWGMLPGGYPEALPNPIMAISAGGLVVTLGTTPDRFINSYGTTFNSITDFAPTDNLIGTQQFTPIKLSFATPVFGAGLQAENQTGDQYGTVTIAATITAVVEAAAPAWPSRPPSPCSGSGCSGSLRRADAATDSIGQGAPRIRSSNAPSTASNISAVSRPVFVL